MTDTSATSTTSEAGTPLPETTTETSPNPSLVAQIPSPTEKTNTTTEAEVAPLTLDVLTLPEGFDKADPLAGKFLEVVNGNATKAEMANALLQLQAEAIAAQADQWLATQAGWQEAVKADPVFGGAKLDENLGKVSTLINEFATKNGGPQIGQEVRDAMDLTGAGNHPAIVKFLIWTCGQLSEGTPLSGGSTAGGEVSRAQKLFGT